MQLNKVLRKHVAIIHAYSCMSALQRKVFNTLLYEAVSETNSISHKESVSVECIMPLSKLKKEINFASNNTRYLKESIDDLASIKMEWNLLRDKVPSNISFLNLRILHGAPTFFDDGSFNFSIHKVLLDLINSSSSVYGSIDIDLQKLFESKYSHSLYENSTRFTHLNKSKIVQLDVFRKLLGVDSEKYAGMKEFTRNVIKPSIEEVNDRADFVVSLNPVKCGRKISGFELDVVSKKSSIPVNGSANDDLVELRSKIQKVFGDISKRVIDDILRNNTKEYILEKIEYTISKTRKDSFGHYPIAYFVSAIKLDYTSGESRDLSRKTSQEESVVTSEKNSYSEWRRKYASLLADLNHWKKNLSEADPSNMTLINNIETVIIDCEGKIEQHLQQKPIEITDIESSGD